MRQSRNFYALLLGVCCMLPCGHPASALGADWMAGKKFDWALDQPVVATWQNAEMRLAVRTLSEQRKVPVLFDRRLDPNHMFSLVTRGEPLRDVWPQLAKLAAGSVSNTGQTIYLGPATSAGKLRTLIALRQAEIQALDLKSLSSERRKLPAQKRELKWEDLDAPRAILQHMATEWDLQLKNPEFVPHDLWGAGELPPVPLAEAATLILIQFDLTFHLTVQDKTLSMEFVPVPEMVSVERTWPLPRAKAESISQAIHSEIPGVAVQSNAEQLVARGTQEQLEELEKMIRSISIGGTARKQPVAAAPLAKRRITFQAKDAPLAAILEKLAETGIQFEYDRAELKAAGIDIDKLVEVDVKDVRPDELFQKLFQPHRIDYEVQGLKVTLKPRD